VIRSSHGGLGREVMKNALLDIIPVMIEVVFFNKLCLCHCCEAVSCYYICNLFDMVVVLVATLMRL